MGFAVTGERRVFLSISERILMILLIVGGVLAGKLLSIITGIDNGLILLVSGYAIAFAMFFFSGSCGSLLHVSG